MADKPILFSAPMVRALLDDRKTQTRRIAKFIENDGGEDYHLFNGGGGVIGVPESRVPSYGPDYAPIAVGDRLWVKETTFKCNECSYTNYVEGGNKSASGRNFHCAACDAFFDGKKTPSIFMPRNVSRTTLVVTNVRVERVQDISEADAMAEGVPKVHEGNIGDEVFCPICRGDGVHGAVGHGYGATEVSCQECLTAKQKFANLWVAINGVASWEANPWVAAYSFNVHHGNIDSVQP